MAKSRKRNKPSADDSKQRQQQTDDVPPKTTIHRFARGLVIAEFVLLIGIGILAFTSLINASIQSSGGATRSSQVKLAERQAEIEQALRERESAEQGFDRTAERPSDRPIVRPVSDLR